MDTASASRSAPRFLPDDFRAKGTRPRDHIVRAATAAFLAQANSHSDGGAEEWAQRLYRGDGVTGFILRSATSPATTTQAGWAAELAQQSVADFMGGLTGLSAASRVLSLGTTLDFGRRGSILVPSIPTTAGDAGGWVQQGSPIPVRKLTTASVVVSPRKLGTISVLSVELSKASASAVEQTVRTVLSEAAALALDTSFFSTTAGSAIRPAGILNGVTPLTATAGGGDIAMTTDITALATAVSGVAGAGPIVFITSPAQAIVMRLRTGPNFNYEVLPSSALSAGTVIAIAPNALVSAFDSPPRFDTGDQATLHMEDTAPAQIGTAGTPNVVAAPVLSLWQQGLVALRMIMDATWATRAPGAVAYTTGATW